MGNSSELEWDIYFLRICNTIASNSKCLSRKLGAILVKDHAIISSGYNGPARGTKHCNERDIEFYEALDNQLSKIRTEADDKTCPRRYMGYKSGEGLHLCQAGHAERNALIQAARNGISTLDTTLYLNGGHCCKDCCIEMINAGVKELVCLDGSPDYDRYATVILTEGGIKIRKVDPSAI